MESSPRSRPSAPGPDSTLGPGGILGDYRILRVLGEGAMGRVFLAEHTRMGKRVALKLLHAELTHLPEVVARFEREALAAGHIGHPNVAAATDFGRAPDGDLFLVLEYVEGESLRALLDRGPLPLHTALAVARQITSALVAAHALSIVHRDLKPDNVLLAGGLSGATSGLGAGVPMAKVLDFGVAKVPVESSVPSGGTHHVTRAGRVFGTTGYMAPEQALGQDVDTRADLYALGVLIHEMVTGKRPFDAATPAAVLARQLSEPPPSLRTAVAALPGAEALDRLVGSMLARDPASRPSDAATVLATLEGVGQVQAAGEVGSTLATFGALLKVRGEELRGTALERLEQARGTALERMEVVKGTALERLEVVKGTARDRLEEARRHAPAWLRGAEDALERWLEPRRAALPRKLRPWSALGLLALASGAAALLTGLGVLIVVLVVGPAAGDAPASAASGPADAGSAAPGAASSPLAVAGAAAGPSAGAARSAGGDAAGAGSAGAGSAGAGSAGAGGAAAAGAAADPLAGARAHQQAGRAAQAIAAAGKALATHPGLGPSPALAELVHQVALSPAGEAAAFAFALGSMGAPGADLVYRWATEDGLPDRLRQRARRALSSREFRRVSTPALFVAVELMQATQCAPAHHLLLKARNVGDARSLPWISRLERTTGCAPGDTGDCYPCLRSDERLREARAAIEGRAAARPPAAP